MLALVSTTAPTAPARAQVINQYFPPIGSPVGGSPDAADFARTLDAFAPVGISLHDILFEAQAGDAFGYDSNVDGLPGGARSAVLNTTAQASAQSQWGRNAFNVAASVNDVRFPSRSAQDHTDWTATAGGQYDLGSGRIGATYTHLDLVQLPTDLGASASRERVPYRVDEGALSYTAVTHSPLSLVPGIDLTHYTFGGEPVVTTAAGADASTDAVADAGEEAVDQSYRDRLTVQQSLTARYDLAENDSLLVVGRGTEIRYDRALAGVPDRDSGGFAILGGLDLHDGGPISYRALVGYQQRNYVSGAYRTIRAPIVQAELAWTPTRLTTVSATVTNGIEDGAFENVVGYTATAATLRLQHRYQRNLVLSGYLDVQQASYPSTPAVLASSVLAQAPNNQTLFGGGVGADWLVNRHLRLRASYDVSNQNDVSGRRFTTNELLFSFLLVL